jgi:hypothetical protein
VLILLISVAVFCSALLDLSSLLSNTLQLPLSTVNGPKAGSMVCLPRPLPVLRRLCSFPPLPEATGRGFLLTFEMGGGHTPLPLPLSYHTTPLDFRGDKPRLDRMPADQRDSLLYPIFLDSLRDFYCWVFVTSIFLLEFAAIVLAP